MEILAPAGSREALERAQAAGADAVYLGYSAFSARAGAGNFDEEGLREALDFAHLHHMRVYVTVNTLVKDGEWKELEALLRLLNELRVDGVLVQDLGVLRLARTHFPGLRVHASTQMAIHNETGVRWCRRMGMKRVVLARECSLAEIRRCADTGMEIEVFGHGAQCVSVSGECLFSSMVGERSGNRGRCAQPCRKRYRLDGKEGAWLSPRDLCLRDRIPALAEAGAASLKIEGRLKRPEYVYLVTDSYRRGLDRLKAGEFSPAEAEEMESLRQIFHRGGFMEGYAFGAEDAGVIWPWSVNHQGIRIGEVTECRGNLARVRLERPLHDGDGLRGTQGTGGDEPAGHWENPERPRSMEIARDRMSSAEARRLQTWEMTYSGRDIPAGETAILRLREGCRARPGDRVWRLTDAGQLKSAMDAPARKIPVEMTLEAWPNREIRLRVSDGENEAVITGEVVQEARNRETREEEIIRQLGKTGGTDFEIRKLQVKTAGAFIPVSRLNGLRREGLAQLAEQRREKFAYPAGPERNPDRWQNGEAGAEALERTLPAWMVTVHTAEQAEACRDQETVVIWYPEDFRREALGTVAEKMRPGEWLRLPEVCEEETLKEIQEIVFEHRDKLGGVLLGSVGQLGLKWSVPVAGGPGIPVMNREAARLLREEGCRFATASPELTGAEWEILRRPGAGVPVIAAPVYGRTQLMLLHHCPARTAQGWHQGHAACRLCEEGDPRALRGKTLEDERGYAFPLLRQRLPEGCLVRLMNTLPTDLGGLRIAAPWAIEMTTETREEAASVMQALRRGEKTPASSTRGHWRRPVT